MGEAYELVNGVCPWVATAPQPVLTINGHTAVISQVRFVWSGASCGWCRQTVHLWSDGGTIDAGIQLPLPGSAAGASWFTIYRPAAAPRIPDRCPNPNCHHPATRRLSTGQEVPVGWLVDRWIVAIGPFALAAHTDPRCPLPANPLAFDLLNEVWATLRASYPEPVAQADAALARRRGPAGRT
jgi:hypothetical protein